MGEISLKETQNLELGILKYLDDICSKNGIQYFLAYGSLIGAIRHQGFIPWDDDIDVMMPREDFYKFVDILTNNPHKFYKLVSYETDTNFTAPLPKLIDERTELIQNYDFRERVSLGVYIDIFILDAAGNTPAEAKRNYDKSIKLYRDWRISDLRILPPNRNKLYGILRWLKHLPNHCFGISHYLTKLKEFGEERAISDNKYLSTFGTGTESYSRNVWLKSDFYPAQRAQFEDLSLSIPNNHDLVLRKEYGDYMKLPPREKQKTHHNYVLKWRNQVVK